MPPQMTPTDKNVLDMLARFRFLTTPQIKESCYPDYQPATQATKASRTLRKLRDFGLVESRWAMDKERIHYLTVTGCDMVDVEGNNVGVRLSDYEHDKLLTDLCFSLQTLNSVAQVRTEREIRSEDPDPETNEWSIPITRISGKKGYAWADLISINTNGSIWGHEVEYTAKRKDRLRRLMYAYGAASKFTGAIYYTLPASHSVVSWCADDINKVLTDHGHGEQILVRELYPFLEKHPPAKQLATPTQNN